MSEQLSINRDNVLSPSEDFNFLRTEGIKLIQNLSGKIWSDYNTHDPGITLLEALCYVLTDLGYRTSYDIKDILAAKESQAGKSKNDLYTASQILPCNPVTLNDYRKLVIDTKGVRNAWIEISDNYEILIYLHLEKNDKDSQEQKFGLTYDAKKADDILRLRGLYKVFVEFENDILEEKREEEITGIIRKKLNFHRNLCEDFISVTSIEYQYFSIEAVLQVCEGTDIEKINAQVYEVIYNFFSPPVLFYSLGQMMEKGYAAEEIFEGPLLKHGFIDTNEMEKSERYKEVHLSDIISLISDIDGVIAIKKLALPVDSETPFSDFTEWINHVKDKQKAPRLDIENSIVTFVRSGDRHRVASDKQADKKRVKSVFSFLQSSKLQARLKGLGADIKIPVGEYMNISDYFPMQRSLPEAYKMAETYIDHHVDEAAVKRAVRQLKEVKKSERLPAPLYDKTVLLGEAVSKILGKSLHHFTGEVDIDEEKMIAIRDEYKARQLYYLDKRKKETLQLRGFLMVFEQILSDYLSQLNNLSTLFSFTDNTANPVKQTFFPQPLQGIQDIELLFIDYKKYKESLVKITETESRFYKRRNEILDHLMARFSESFDKYSFYLQSSLGKKAGEKMIADKTRFLSDYIQLSNYRGKAFDYSNSLTNPENVWNSDNVEGFKKRICRMMGITNYTRRHIATDLIFIEKRKLDNDIVRYVVILNDPADKNNVLLESIEFEFESEADEILNYILEHGYNRNLYEKEVHKDKWFYNLKKISQEDDYQIVAKGKNYSKSKEETKTFEATIDTLTEISENENFHILEHILLRPKIPPREKTTKKGSSYADADSVQLLPALEVSDNERFVKSEQQSSPYKFNITNLSDPENDTRIIWRLSLLEDDNSEILTVNEDFIFYKNLTRRIEYIKEFASDSVNYVIDQNADGYYIFRIMDQDRVLTLSRKNYRIKDDIDTEIRNLVNFFSYETLLAENKNTDDEISFYTDPYSFQVSVFIPRWPARFRDPTFKHMLEKTIYMETPSHVYPHVYWLDHTQMKQFEEAYKLWIEELTSVEIPNTEVLNNLISVLKEVRNHS